MFYDCPTENCWCFTCFIFFSAKFITAMFNAVVIIQLVVESRPQVSVNNKTLENKGVKWEVQRQIIQGSHGHCMVSRDPGFFRISASLSPWCVVLNFIVQDRCWSSSYHTYTPKSKMEEGWRIASYIQYKKTSETPHNIFTIYHFFKF